MEKDVFNIKAEEFINLKGKISSKYIGNNNNICNTKITHLIFENIFSIASLSTISVLFKRITSANATCLSNKTYVNYWTLLHSFKKASKDF